MCFWMKNSQSKEMQTKWGSYLRYAGKKIFFSEEGIFRLKLERGDNLCVLDICKVYMP